MNVLIFVMTMLMMLTLMTYARLESYRSSQAVQIIFRDYMEGKERGGINTRAEMTYKEIESTKSETGGGGGKRKQINANRRITVSLIFDPKRESKGREWEQTKVLFKKLIKTLYEKQPFYQEIERERPSFQDDLIQAITQSIDALPSTERPRDAAGLANLELADPQLDQVLYKMLHGASYAEMENGKLAVPANKKKNEEVDLETSDERDNNADEAKEFKSPKGYYSLLDFITSASSPQVRIYLASKEVLEAVFPDPATVGSIIEERQRLYNQANNSGDINQLDELFKNQFMKMRDPAIDEALLNFSVSKTNPKNYK